MRQQNGSAIAVGMSASRFGSVTAPWERTRIGSFNVTYAMLIDSPVFAISAGHLTRRYSQDQPRRSRPGTFTAYSKPDFRLWNW